MTDKIWEFLTDNRLRLVIIHETQICENTHHCLITDKQKQTLKLLRFLCVNFFIEFEYPKGSKLFSYCSSSNKNNASQTDGEMELK